MRTRSCLLLAVACAALLCTTGAAAATDGTGHAYGTPQASGPRQVDPDGLSLKAGEFAWFPDPGADSAAPVTLRVNLLEQRAYVYRDGRRIGVTTVSTGKPGHDTPTGVFPILGKEAMHHSSKYDNAPMPWMQRLTQWGHALHAGNVRPFPASHGCVRLPAAFARQLFSMTKRGDLVVISQDDSPRSLAIALATAGLDSQVALAVGVTEPLPPIVFVKPGQETSSGVAVEAGVMPMAGF